jgi:(p)ppGpp synthase/HD superfamily hydrolase
MTLDEAIALAARAHASQLDQGGNSYVLHPLRVMRAVPADAKIAAVLHDVLERSAISLDDLAAAGVDEPSLTAVDLLTRAPAQATERPGYEEYIERIANAPGESGRIARAVKLADLADKLARLPAGKRHREPRYRSALAVLQRVAEPRPFAERMAARTGSRPAPR